MKKFLLSIFAVMLAVFSVQAEEVTKSVTFSNYTAGTQYADNEKHDLGDGLVIYTTKCHFTSELRIYSSSTNNGYVVSDALPGTITKMTFNAGNKKDVLVVYGSNDGASWTQVGEVSITSTSYYDYSLNFTGSYTRFKLDVKGSNQVRLKSMSVTYTKTTGESGGETPVVETVATPVISAESTTFNEGESLIVTIETETEGAEIYYTLDGSDPVENGDLYEGEIELTETTTVKAVAMLEGWNNSEVAEATFTAVDPNAKEVEATISFASTAQRVSQSSSEQVWANAGVTFTNSGNVANYSDPVRLYASSKVVVEHEAMTKIVFVCNNSSYATALKNSIGNDATVSNSNVTVTFANPVDEFTIASLTAQVRLNSLTVTYVTTEKVVKAPAISPESCGFYVGENVEVTIAAEEGTIYYTLDGNDPTNSSEVYSAPFTVSETTTVKAIAVVDGTASEVTTAIYTKGIEGTVTDAFDAYVDGERLPAVVTGYIVGYVNGSAVGEAGENCVFDADGEEIKNTNILIANEPNETDYTKCLAVQLPNNEIRTALNLADNANNLNKMVVIKGSLEKYLGIAGLKDLVAGELVEESWSSFYAAMDTQIPAGVEAYIVTTANKEYVTLTQIFGTIPAMTGVIFKSNPKSNTGSEELANVEGNLLEGVLMNTNKTEEAYVLGCVDGEYGFYKADMNQLDGTAWLANAGKAYLPVSALPASAQGAASFSFRFGEGTTGIENVEVENASNVIYDLTGRRVEEITAPGIYIVNGVKRVVR